MVVRKRQISSSPEVISDDELSDVPSNIEGEEEEVEEDDVEDEEDGEEDEGEDEGEEEEGEEGEGDEEEEEEEAEDDDEQQEEEEEIEDQDEEEPVEEEEEEEHELEDEEEEEEEEDEEDADFDEDEGPLSSEEEEDDDSEPPIPATTTTSKGRISRKPVSLQPPPPPVSTRPSRASTRAEPAPEPPKIKLKLSLTRQPQREAMEEIKVESPPKEVKSTTRAAAAKEKVEAKLVVPKISEKARGKQPEVVAEDDDEEESSSIVEEDEEDLSEIDEEDIPGGTEMDLDEDEDDEDTERSRTGTPMDPSRLTKRQLARFDGSLRPHSLMSLPNETLRKRPLTADEIALRRSETARRRKNQSEQRLEEEKIETINRLLKPQAPRRRGQRVNESPGPSESEMIPREPTPPPPPTKVRIVRNAEGAFLAIPDRWLGLFEAKKGSGPRKIEDCSMCGKKGIYPVNGKRACSLGCFKALKAGS